MSFDDVFALLIIVIFVGLPLLNRLRSGGQRPGAPGGAPGRPGAPSGPAAERDHRKGAPSDADPMDELSRRLEEARRRVREAMGEAPETHRDRPLVSEPPRGQTIASAGMPSGSVGGTTRPPAPPPTPQPSPQSVRRVGAPAKPEAVKRTGTGRRPPGFARPTPGLEVERSAGRGAAGSIQERARRDRARAEAATLMSLDSGSIRKGLLWHMILGEPTAFGRGRMRSPRPSR